MTGPNTNAIGVFTDKRSPLDQRMAERLAAEILDAVEALENPTRLEVAAALGIRRQRLTRIIIALGIEAAFENAQKATRLVNSIL